VRKHSRVPGLVVGRLSRGGGCLSPSRPASQRKASRGSTGAFERAVSTSRIRLTDVRPPKIMAMNASARAQQPRPGPEVNRFDALTIYTQAAGSEGLRNSFQREASRRCSNWSST
jgi:hypothetical protein